MNALERFAAVPSVNLVGCSMKTILLYLEFLLTRFDEMAKYDLPAFVEYILNTTRASQLSYIGHSQGILDQKHV